MRRVLLPAEVEVDKHGDPVKVVVRGWTYKVDSIEEPMWIDTLPWWEKGRAGAPVEELEVRHHMVRVGGDSPKIVHLRQGHGGWTVVGVED
jgi:hypothetical protein